MQATRVDAVMKAAAESGLLKREEQPYRWPDQPGLAPPGQEANGIESDTDLIEFALANVALEENFAEAFKQSRGKINGNLKLGF
jgi:hypothetical protein